MKKLISLLLTLCLLCGVVALADTTINQGSDDKAATTTVSYTINTCEDYTVTIPSSVSMSGTSDNISGTISISLDTTTFNVASKTIKVVLSSAANGYTDGKYALVNGENKINYTLKRSGQEFKLGDTLIEWTYGNGTQVSVSLIAQAYPSANLPAGNYTDTLTFTVSVESTEANIGGGND